jgi:tRNA nucleotidyltransferase (CCA-adding enzyme)
VISGIRERLAGSPVLAAVAGEPGVYVVGGAVRDALLGRMPAELDLVVEGDAVPVARRAAERLGGEVTVHERFGTASVHAPPAVFDIASARTENYPAAGALPDVRLGAPLPADLARRDFSVNAIALGVADGQLTAFPGALEDVSTGVLRVLHDASFRDDPTRLLRLARYAARLGFAVEPKTAELAVEAVAGGALATVSGERLGTELRLLAREPQPAALEALARFGLGAALLPGFAVDPDYVARALALAPDDARRDLIALGAVARFDAATLDHLAFPGADRRPLLAAAGLDPVGARLRAARRPSEVRRLLVREPIEVSVLAAAHGDEGARRWIAEWRHVRPAIDGNDLVAAGLHGPAVGAGLEAAMSALLDGRAPDRESQLAAALAGARVPRGG